MRRIIIGAGGVQYPGWVSTDIGQLNLLDVRSFQSYFDAIGNCVDAFLCEAVFEHLPIESLLDAARLCYRFLKPGGYIRAAVPDGYHPDENYINCVKPGGWGSGADTHASLFTYEQFVLLFAGAGFRPVRLLEWWGPDGRFHVRPWSTEQGPIDRCLAHDPRNQADGKPHYTSIILDAFKG